MKQSGLVQQWVLPSAGILLGLTAITVGVLNTTTIAPAEAQEVVLRHSQ